MTARCPYCHADPEGDLDAAIRALQACINCAVDIRSRGDWTGLGWGTVKRLAELHGWPAVHAADTRVHAAAKAARDTEAAGQRVTIGDGDTVHILASRTRTVCGRGGQFSPARFDGDPLCRSCARRASIVVASDGTRMAVEVAL